jgi:UDP-N-acetyl-D-galactosamine dehydrogenase
MKTSVCIVGLGYVGLPLAHAFAAKGHTVYGYDISERRIADLKNGHDRTNEISPAELKRVSIHYTKDPSVIGKAEFVIVAVPTPVDKKNKPDLSFVESSAKAVGKHLAKGSVVIYEATVYPGVTEDICGPLIEKASGMMRGRDFHLGYSPERINPGDKEHTVTRITKIVAGEDDATLKRVAKLYESVIKAGVHRAPSIKVAEMAKAIENAQRDLNIAYINEIALLCTAIGIRTQDVLKAAATKWNFLNFTPGLVGGHCIGVDPYYLVEMAKKLKVKTNVISAGRKINDAMSTIVVEQVWRALAPIRQKRKPRVLVMGMTFKEDIPDTRNSKSFDVVQAFKKRACSVEVHDPFLTSTDIASLKLAQGTLRHGPYDAIVVLVRHREYKSVPMKQWLAALSPKAVVYDLKAMLDRKEIKAAGHVYISL